MHTGESILIKVPREKIFAVVSDLGRWPVLLPHYRSVTFLAKESGRDIVRMAASRSGLPISWVSAYEADPVSLELRFEHLRHWTKGMQVVWTLTPTRDGTRVEIVHELDFRIRSLAWLAEPVIGGFFIGNIARKTLRAFKQVLESAAGGGEASDRQS